MKLTYEDKIQIYILRKQGRSFKELSKRFGVDVSGLKYMVRLIERYGIEIVKKGKNRYYSPELKEEIINKVLLKGRSRKSVSLDSRKTYLFDTIRSPCSIHIEPLRSLISGLRLKQFPKLFYSQ